MTPLLPAQAFGMTSAATSPLFVVMLGGRMIRNVDKARIDAMMASQPSASQNLYVTARTTMIANTLKVPPATAFRGSVQCAPNSEAMNSGYPGIGRLAMSRNTDPQIVNGVVIMNPSRSAATALISAKRPINSMNLSNISCFVIVKLLFPFSSFFFTARL